MKLRSYHNPEAVDESLVPPGYRLLYADEPRTELFPEGFGMMCPTTRFWYWVEGNIIELSRTMIRKINA